MPRYYSLLFIILTFTFTGCSIFKQNDPEKDLRVFIDQFEKNLTATDDVVMNQFQLAPDQGVTREGILKVIRILQNHDQAQDSITCRVNFQDLNFVSEPAGTRVDVTAQFISLDSSLNIDQKSSFKLWLSPVDDQLFITRIDAEEFYFDYQGAVRDQQDRKHRERDIASRKIFFEQGRMLQKNYDSVIWYTRYHDSLYYYVVNSKWNGLYLNDEEFSLDSVKMGLVSESGRVIVPADYNLVGTIGFEQDGIIEVTRNGHVGHFDLEGNVLIPAIYNWIVPYINNDTRALVKQDSVYGWIDAGYTYHAGFPSAEAERYVREFRYLDEFKVISSTTTTMTEVLSMDHIGYGIVMPTRHFVSNGVLREIVPYLYLDGSDWGGTEKIETQKTFFETITDNLSAFMVSLNEYYVEGREGFYKRNNLSFVNRDGVVINTFVVGEGEMKINRIDSTLLEIGQKVATDFSNVVPFEEVNNTDGYVHRSFFTYFRLAGTQITKIESSRRFDFTALVKLDSSYITGRYMAYTDGEDSEFLRYTLLPSKELQRMRDEILAEYGFIFTDPDDSRFCANANWYAPRFQHYSEFLDSMTEIDRYNLEFLEKIIGTRNPPAS